LEKEARLVLNEIMAKLNMNEKMIGGGAVVVLVGWILGLVLTSSGSYAGVGSFSWYGSSGAQGMGLIAVVAAVAAVVVIYLKYAPNMKIAWPAPLPLILLVIAAVAAVFAALGLLQAFTYDPFSGLCSLYGAACPSKPILLYVAAGAVLVGGAVMVYGGYMEYSTNKTAV
jgi:hypothetical protein